MAERVAGERDHQDVGFLVAERAHALEAEPVLAGLAIECPARPMAPLPRDIAPFGRRGLAQHRHVVFGAVDVDRGMGKVRHAAGVVAVEMRQQHVTHIAG